MERDNIEAILQRGIEFHRNSQFLEAEACYKQVLAIDPNNADAIHLLGLLADAIGDKNLAIDLIRTAISTDPGNAIFHGNLGNILKTLGQTEQAVASYLEALKFNPLSIESCFNLATLYRDLDRLDDAIPLYQQVTALHPDFAIAWINLGETLHKLGQLDESIHCYKKYLELKPDDIFCKTRLADAYFEQGRKFEDNRQIDEAMVSFESAISVLPTHAASQNKLDYLRDEFARSVQQEAKEPQNLDRKLVAIDIGCRWGFAEKFIKKIEAFALYGFDPDVAECQRLAEAYRHHNSITLVPLGLASSRGKHTIYLTREPGCSSLLMPDPELTAHYPALACATHIGDSCIETTTLDIWAHDNGVDVIDYIKIDTQGTELDILRGCIQILDKVRCLEIEVEFNPIYLNQPLFSDVDCFLRKMGFVLWKFTNMVHYGRGETSTEPLGDDIIHYDSNSVRHSTYRGQLYWAEAHFIKQDVLTYRPMHDPQRLRDETLFSTLGMHDVVHHISTLNAK